MNRLLLGDLGGLLKEPLFQVLELQGLSFHVPIGLLKLVEAAVAVGGSLLQFLLSLLERGGQAIEPKQVRLIFGLILVQGFSILHELPLALLAFSHSIGLLLMQFLLP